MSFGIIHGMKTGLKLRCCWAKLTYRRVWMLAGFAFAILVGDMFLAIIGASTKSVEFLYGVAGFSMAQICWTVAQLREARPDRRVFFALAALLALFVFTMLMPPVLPVAATVAICVYSVLTALSFSTALATRRVFYICGIGLLLVSDIFLGLRFARVPGCGDIVGPTYIAAELCLLTSFFWTGEKRLCRKS